MENLRTPRAAERETESQMDYRLRRIAWAENELTIQEKPAVRWQVLKLAGIRDCDWDKCWEEYMSKGSAEKEEEYAAV